MGRLVRMIVFFLYIYGISRAKDIQRVFQYHGAEHKTIHAYEAGVELIPEKCTEIFSITSTLWNIIFINCYDCQHFYVFFLRLAKPLGTYYF